MMTAGLVSRQGVSDGRSYIGLRERVEDALERAQLNGQVVSKDTHVLLGLFFSQEGVAHDTLQNTGMGHNYIPMLQKCIYWDRHDWKVWHFTGDITLQSSTYLETKWLEIC